MARIYVDDNDEPQLIESEYVHVTISQPTRLMNAIDSIRGDIPRSTFIRRILERSKVISDYLRKQEESEEEAPVLYKKTDGHYPIRKEVNRESENILLADNKDGSDKHQ